MNEISNTGGTGNVNAIEEDLDIAKVESLRLHIGSSPQECPVFFFVEEGPHSPRGAKCRLPSCREYIPPFTFRIALQPGKSGWLPHHKSTDYYHVDCFEKIVDFSQANYLDRLFTTNPGTLNLRGLPPVSLMLSSGYVCKAVVVRLVEEWKLQRGRWMDERDGVDQGERDEDLHELMHKAGSSSFTPKKLPDMTDEAFKLFTQKLAPIESDGPNDTEEWNLFEVYLPPEDEKHRLYEKDGLSKMLHRWRIDSKVSVLSEEDLSDLGKQYKAQLSAKAIRAIRRLNGLDGFF